MVGGEGGMASRGRPVRVPRTVPPPVGAPQLAKEKLTVGDGCHGPVLTTERGGRLAQGRQHQAVPLCQDLVIKTRTQPQFPRCEQLLPRLLDVRGTNQLSAV